MSRAAAEIPTQHDGAPARNAALETVARRERMVAAAVELATAGGYEAVQMRDVAARAEVALGTLYRHYASKDQLLLAAMAQQASNLRERLVQRPPNGDTPAARVSDVLKRASRALERAEETRAAHRVRIGIKLILACREMERHHLKQALRACIAADLRIPARFNLHDCRQQIRIEVVERHPFRNVIRPVIHAGREHRRDPVAAW